MPVSSRKSVNEDGNMLPFDDETELMEDKMIKGLSIKNISRVISEARGADSVRYVVRRDSIGIERQGTIGIDYLEEAGDAILPSGIGKVSNFNISGREKKRKDLPLIKKTIPQYRTWKDWHGKEHDGIQHRTMDVYQVEFIPPPSEKLFLIEINNTPYITSRQITIRGDQFNTIHIANLMLEYFGEFEIFDTLKDNISVIPTRHLQWEVLPPGKYPWNKAASFVLPHLTRLSSSERGVIEHRMREITKHQPDFLATGRGGYSGYFIYGFTSRNLFFLESTELNNATYVFGEDWEKLSSLSKEKIINGEHAYARIVHDKKWMNRIRQLFREN